MTVRLVDPEGLASHPLYAQAAVATGTTQVHLGVEQARQDLGAPRAPLSLIGVDILFEEGNLIEAEVTAVLDRPAEPGDDGPAR
ncbi:hypothetical protein [Desertihabitans aurantiacus]|uniref:hypothetical protein n=1 Tax=Desertihabitans aurantiacus TaxID=2282477 RepID=UPI000DF72DCF|nr:hypothetical protein [Desertihabitans aurantiacus]